MVVTQYVLGSILIALAIALLVLVLMQTGKDKKLSGTIAGGSSDTYLGKGKGRNREKILAIVTTVIAIVFVVLVVITCAIISRNAALIQSALKSAA